jgi:signal transduction histidine kinase
MVRADPARLSQVLSNLLSNAVKYSPRGAEVVVGIKDWHGRIRILVRDHGPGIPEKYKDRVFDKFIQVNANGAHQKSGTGLGLSIVKQIVERLDGEVGFESAPDGGTIFHVTLPRWKAGMEADGRRRQRSGGGRR